MAAAVTSNAVAGREAACAAEGALFYKEGKQMSSRAEANKKFADASERFTAAIIINPKKASYYASRALCHLELQDYLKTVKDCDIGLDMLQSRTSKEAAKLLFRKGKAFFALERFQEALKCDLEALTLLPGNEEILEDIDILKSLVNEDISNSNTFNSSNSFKEEYHYSDTASSPRSVSSSDAPTFAVVTNAFTAQPRKNAKDPHADPSNPWRAVDVYIGNWSGPNASLKRFRKLLQPYGVLKAHDCRPDQHYAVATFHDYTHAAACMKDLNGKIFDGEPLKLRYQVDATQASNPLAIPHVVSPSKSEAARENNDASSGDHYWSPAANIARLSINGIRNDANNLTNNLRENSSQKPGLFKHNQACAAFVGFSSFLPNGLENLPSETELKNIFSACGEIVSCRILPDRRCAFVNYVKPESVDNAITLFDGKIIGTVKLAIRHKNNP